MFGEGQARREDPSGPFWRARGGGVRGPGWLVVGGASEPGGHSQNREKSRLLKKKQNKSKKGESGTGGRERNTRGGPGRLGSRPQRPFRVLKRRHGIIGWNVSVPAGICAPASPNGLGPAGPRGAVLRKRAPSQLQALTSLMGLDVSSLPVWGGSRSRTRPGTHPPLAPLKGREHPLPRAWCFWGQGGHARPARGTEGGLGGVSPGQHLVTHTSAPRPHVCDSSTPLSWGDQGSPSTRAHPESGPCVRGHALDTRALTRSGLGLGVGPTPPGPRCGACLGEGTAWGWRVRP